MEMSMRQMMTDSANNIPFIKGFPDHPVDDSFQHTTDTTFTLNAAAFGGPSGLDKQK